MVKNIYKVIIFYHKWVNMLNTLILINWIKGYFQGIGYF